MGGNPRVTRALGHNHPNVVLRSAVRAVVLLSIHTRAKPLKLES